MYQYSNSLIRKFYSDVDGNAAIGVQATVYVGETNTLAQLFDGSGAAKANPVTTDQFGFYSFSVADGDYRIVFSSSQFATLRISVLDGAAIREEFDDLVESNTAFRNEQQAAYDAFVLSQGWTQVGTFAAGFTFTSPNQVGQDADGNWWRWNGALPKTVTAGTLPSSDANYKLVGDGVLRNDLANGTADVGGLTSGETGKRLRKTISADEYGYNHTATATENKAALKAAVAACSRGFTLLIPETGEICNIDTTLGESDAVLVDKKITIKHHGRMKANYGVLESNPATIFKLAAKGAVLTGTGCIYGSGVVDDTNVGDTNTIPSLVLVTADNVKIDVDMECPPKTAVNIRNCWRCKVKGEYVGGLLNYTIGNTAYFGIYAAGGGKHRFYNLDFEVSEEGGRFVTCVFTAYSNNCKLFKINADRPFEKLCYLYGNNNTISGSHCEGDPDVVAGFSGVGDPPRRGTITSVYRTEGSRNVIRNNTSNKCRAGATARGGIDNIIEDNQFYLCGQAGVTVFHEAGETVSIPWTGYKIKGNKSTAWPEAESGWTLTNGIEILARLQDFVDFDVSDNKSIGWGDGTGGEINALYAAAIAPYAIRDSKFNGNKSRDCNHGIKAELVTNSEISRNRAENITGWALRNNGGTKNKWLSNTGYNIANIGIQAIDAESEACGNSYTDKPLSGIATLAAAAVTIVTHGGCAPNGKVFLQEAGFSAGGLTAITGVLTDISGTNFRILTGNTGDASGGEQFWYRIDQ